MPEAGGNSAQRFSASYPVEYKVLGYARLDVSQRPISAWIVRLTGGMLPVAARAADRMIAYGWVPFPVCGLFVKIVNGLSFMLGTAHRRPNEAES